MKGQPVMKNTIALGASLAILGSEIEPLAKIIEEQFKKKGEEVIVFNQRFAREGYDFVKKKLSFADKAVVSSKKFGGKTSSQWQ